MPAPPAASAVLVAIRVRPFNEREKTRNVQPLVRMPAGGKITELRCAIHPFAFQSIVMALTQGSDRGRGAAFHF